MINTTVNPEVHHVVVIIDGNHLGFTGLSSAVTFVEEIYAGEQPNKLYNAVVTALSDDKEDGFQIYDINTYVDLFMDDEEEVEL